MLGTYSDPLSTSAATESYSRLAVAALGNAKPWPRPVCIRFPTSPSTDFFFLGGGGEGSQACGVCNQIRGTVRGCLKPNKEPAVSCFTFDSFVPGDEIVSSVLASKHGSFSPGNKILPLCVAAHASHGHGHRCCSPGPWIMDRDPNHSVEGKGPDATTATLAPPVRPLTFAVPDACFLPEAAGIRRRVSKHDSDIRNPQPLRCDPSPGLALEHTLDLFSPTKGDHSCEVLSGSRRSRGPSLCTRPTRRRPQSSRRPG